MNLTKKKKKNLKTGRSTVSVPVTEERGEDQSLRWERAYDAKTEGKKSNTQTVFALEEERTDRIDL